MAISTNNSLWTERYRPQTIEDYVFKDDSQREQVVSWVKAKEIPHLLFSGAAGIGKTTMALLLINLLEIDPYDVLVVNASRENGVDFIRDKIHPFCQTMPFGTMKIVLLDEADRISPSGQDALKATMEEFSACVRFILTSNHPKKVLPPLHSRCQGTHFEKIDHTEFTARVATILVTENVVFDLDTLDIYVKATYPDLRKCINSIQQNSTTGTLKMPSAADKAVLDYKIEFVRLFKAGKVREARTLFCSSATSEDPDDVIVWCYNNLDLWSDSEEGQDEAILIIRNALVNTSFCADFEINMAAMMTELILIDQTTNVRRNIDAVAKAINN